MFGVMFNLGAQALNVDIDQSRVRCMPVTPDFLQQDFASEHLAWRAGQTRQ